MHHIRSYPFKSKLFVKTKFISSILFFLIVLPFVWRDSWLTVVFYLHVRPSSFPVRALCWENSGLELWFNCRQALIYNNEWISLLNLQTLDNADPKKLSGASSFGVCRKHKHNSLNEDQHQLLETGESAVLESRSVNVVEPKFLLEKSLNKYFKFYKVTHVVKGIQERIKLASYINGKISIVTSKFLQVFILWFCRCSLSIFYSSWVCSSLDNSKSINKNM